jgi:hypothetical protein
MGVAEWREGYQASPSEVLDLLDFTRVRSRSLLTTLLETGAVTVDLPAAGRIPGPGRRLSLERARNEPAPEPLGLYADDQLAAIIASEDHADAQAILDTGLDLGLDLDDWVDPPVLRVTLPLRDRSK